MIWTTPELSVKNVTHLLLKALPLNCIATTIGKNSRIVIWYFNQSVGHLIANQCFRNRPPNPILLASVYKFKPGIKNTAADHLSRLQIQKFREEFPLMDPLPIVNSVDIPQL
jgi:hypothetical protein